MKQIIDSEVTAILSTTIKRTKKATQQSIINSFDSRPPWRTFNGKKYNINWKLPNRVWSDIQTRMAQSLQAKLAAKALAAQVWYLLGLKIGPINAPADVVSAKKEGLDNSDNGAVKKTLNTDDYGIEVMNRSPLIRFSESRQAFFSAIAGRIGFFRQNLKRGVFSSMEKTLKKYPGLKIQ